MSYDLMVFDPDAPPPDRGGFMAWYKKQTEWTEDHGYHNPEVCTPGLRSWFLDMIKQYPPMNGPYATNDDDNPKLTEYSVGKTVVYAAFSWSQAESARQTVFSLAKKHAVGFFDVSAADGGVWLPSSDGKYVLRHGG